MSIQNFSFRLPSLPKIICSIPVILITLYLVRPLGAILLIARLFIYGSYRYYRVPTIILVIALLCLIPRGYELLQNNFGDLIPTFQPLVDFRNLPFYENLTNFGRSTVIISIVVLILSVLFSKIANLASHALSATRFFKQEITESEKAQRAEQKQKVDDYKKKLEEKEEREARHEEEMRHLKDKVKNQKAGEIEGEIEAEKTRPHVIKCPHCGYNNSVIGTVGKCTHCKNNIEWHKK